MDEYFQRVDELDQAFSDNTDALDSEIEASEDVNEIRGYMNDTIAEFESFVSGLEDLEPPDEAADAHQRAVDGLDDFTSKLSDGVDSLGDAETVDELFAPFENIDGSGQQQAQEACVELEEIAADNSIGVDFSCGD
jgi:hypothetical protein